MVMTYFDMGVRDSEQAWRGIRQMRSGRAARLSSDRRLLFSSALEQAEQQFRASARIGFESRPVNLYYGLSQAGRAIAAALTPEDQDPQVAGHGLRIPGLDDLDDPTALLRLPVRSHGASPGRTAFGRMAELLDSDPMKTSITLAGAWNMILEPSLEKFPDQPQPGWITTSGTDPDSFGFPLAEDSETGDPFAELCTRYPQLAAASLTEQTKGYTEVDGVQIPIRGFHLTNYRTHFSNYRGTMIAMPSTPGGSTLDPLLAWWLVLYALSMIARYRPVLWTRAIDVDSSPIAVPLENLLQKALEAVPDQIRVTLEDRFSGDR